MSNIERTPGKWECTTVPADVHIHHIDIWGEQYGPTVTITTIDTGGNGATYAECIANAEFIVRACNSHDALVTSCKLAIEGVEGMLGGWLGVQQPYAPEWAGALQETLDMLQSTLTKATLEE